MVQSPQYRADHFNPRHVAMHGNQLALYFRPFLHISFILEHVPRYRNVRQRLLSMHGFGLTILTPGSAIMPLGV